LQDLLGEADKVERFAWHGKAGTRAESQGDGAHVCDWLCYVLVRIYSAVGIERQLFAVVMLSPYW